MVSNDKSPHRDCACQQGLQDIQRIPSVYNTVSFGLMVSLDEFEAQNRADELDSDFLLCTDFYSYRIRPESHQWSPIKKLHRQLHTSQAMYEEASVPPISVS